MCPLASTHHYTLSSVGSVLAAKTASGGGCSQPGGIDVASGVGGVQVGREGEPLTDRYLYLSLYLPGYLFSLRNVNPLTLSWIFPASLYPLETVLA